jgi:hypothetical protein
MTAGEILANAFPQAGEPNELAARRPEILDSHGGGDQLVLVGIVRHDAGHPGVTLMASTA